MELLLTFIEGLISFISPCMLPMLPVYISFFAAGGEKNRNVVLKSLFFVLGFTAVFVSLGVFAGFIGSFLVKFGAAINIICGIIVVIFGLSYLEIIHLPFFKGVSGMRNVGSLFSAFLFGVIYSVSLTPCVGAFLGAALMQASNSGTALSGAVLLLFYSLGLGIPFVISALILDSLSGVFGFIKRNYRVINAVCGIFLIIVGVCMAFGVLSDFLMNFI